ncbi:MAG: pyridoxamine 5'-phosphate oxidase family protein [Candidatus Korobacteraceae bacterium]
MANTGNPVAKLNEVIRGIDFAMLTTIRTNGILHSCPMATSAADGDGVVWLLSDTNTEKVEAIRTDQRVNLAYSDPASQRYVSIAGRCELLRDHIKIEQVWKPLYKAWFPKGTEDPNLILLAVHVQFAEYWSEPEGRMVQIQGFSQATIG